MVQMIGHMGSCQLSPHGERAWGGRIHLLTVSCRVCRTRGGLEWTAQSQCADPPATARARPWNACGLRPFPWKACGLRFAHRRRSAAFRLLPACPHPFHGAPGRTGPAGLPTSVPRLGLRLENAPRSPHGLLLPLSSISSRGSILLKGRAGMAGRNWGEPGPKWGELEGEWGKLGSEFGLPPMTCRGTGGPFTIHHLLLEEPAEDMARATRWSTSGEQDLGGAVMTDVPGAQRLSLSPGMPLIHG
jgi:hypothetical protein